MLIEDLSIKKSFCLAISPPGIAVTLQKVTMLQGMFLQQQKRTQQEVGVIHTGYMSGGNGYLSTYACF